LGNTRTNLPLRILKGKLEIEVNVSGTKHILQLKIYSM